MGLVLKKMVKKNKKINEIQVFERIEELLEEIERIMQYLYN